MDLLLLMKKSTLLKFSWIFTKWLLKCKTRLTFLVSTKASCSI